MMKKMLLMMLAGLLVAACEKPVLGEVEDESEISETEVVKSSKNFTFTVKGDFNAATFTRGYLAADGKDMTDLWVFDYVDGVCVQSVHQTAEDEAWGKPTMALAYGSHHVYFVASRGEGANRAVTLDRVATKLKMTVNDEVPDGCAAVVVTPARWYYGWDYVNGVAVAAQQTERRVAVPESYIGTAGQMSVSIFGLSGTDEWVTNISIQAQDADNNVLGSATITGAPFKANRGTEYSGNLFGSAGGLDVSVNAAWENPKTGTW